MKTNQSLLSQLNCRPSSRLSSISPHHAINQLLKQLGITKTKDKCLYLDVDKEFLGRLLKGHERIDGQLAERLASLDGSDHPQYWLKLQGLYDEYVNERKQPKAIPNPNQQNSYGARLPNNSESVELLKDTPEEYRKLFERN